MTRTLVALLALVVACTSARAARADDEHPPERLEALRRVIELEDRREASPEVWRPLVLSEDVTVAYHAVRAVGRTRDAGLAPLLRERISTDRWFRGVDALALCPEPDNVELLLGLAASQTTDVRAAAILALGRHGAHVSAAALFPALSDPRPDVRSSALLALCRLRGRRAATKQRFDPAAERVLVGQLKTLSADEDPQVRVSVAYALHELDLDPEAELHLLELASRRAGPEGRLFVARALGAMAGHEGARVDALLALLDEAAEPHVGAAVAASIARIGSACGARLPEAVRALARASGRTGSPAQFHTRRGAVTALADLVRPTGAAAPVGELVLLALPAVRGALDDASPSVRIEALVAVARLAPADQVAPLVEERAGAERALDRLAAARAARHLPAAARDALLERLRHDDDPRVACEALGALGELAGQGGDALERARAAARAAAAHEDLAIRTTGVLLLGEHGALEDVATIAAVASRSGGSSNAEVRVECANALKALGARDGAPPAQKAAAVAALRASLADAAPAVQAAAARALAELTGDAVPVPPSPPTRSTVELAPEDLLRRPDQNPRVVLHTTKGPIALELLADEAPRHVKSFLALARSGFYDGLRFHRVVSGFVIQGLDPRGDGWGSGDVLVKDEINPVPYLAGTVGMPNAGPDTGGCQLFITHVPTPHLDGGYTVFGRVVEGMDVVHAIDLDDTCESVEVRD